MVCATQTMVGDVNHKLCKSLHAFLRYLCDFAVSISYFYEPEFF